MTSARKTRCQTQLRRKAEAASIPTTPTPAKGQSRAGIGLGTTNTPSGEARDGVGPDFMTPAEQQGNEGDPSQREEVDENRSDDRDLTISMTSKKKSKLREKRGLGP